MAGLRGVADEPHFLRAGEEAALGLLDDEDGLAVCTDALRDAQLAGLLLATVRGVAARPGPVAVLRDDDDATVLDCGDRGDLLVFPWLDEAPRPDVDLMVALDESGFNHVAAPLVRWVWEGSDLGVVQEPLADRSGGLGAGPDLPARLLRVRRFARGRRRRLRCRGPGARHHDRPHAPGPRPRLPAGARAGRRLGRPGRGDDRRVRRVAAGGAGRHRTGQVAPRVRGAAPGHPHPRRLPPGPHGPDGPGVGGQRLRARAASLAPEADGAPPHARWGTWPTCCGRCTAPARSRRPSATPPAGSGWPRSATPGRCGTAGPS